MNVQTTYLQMFAQPQRVVPPPREGLAVIHAKNPPVAYYRFLYEAVGWEYDGTSRKKLSDIELAALLHDPRLEDFMAAADDAMELAKILAGQGRNSDQAFLKSMAPGADLVDHDGQTCGTLVLLCQLYRPDGRMFL